MAFNFVFRTPLDLSLKRAHDDSTDSPTNIMSSSSQTQTVVDPTLSQDNDDFLDSFLDQMACSRPSPSTMTHTFKLSLPPFDVDTEDNEDLHTAVSQQPGPTVPFATSLDFSLASRASLIKQLKQVKAFSKESTLDLDNFSVVSHALLQLICSWFTQRDRPQRSRSVTHSCLPQRWRLETC